MGINHALYGVLGTLGALAYLVLRRDGRLNLLRNALAFISGGVVGYSPVLALLAFAPRFADAFWYNISFFYQRKETNIPLRVPWPWLTPMHFSIFNLRQITEGILFIGLIVFGILGVLYVFWARLKDKPVQPALVASAFLALPYSHYANARADTVHLALGIFPFLLTCARKTGPFCVRKPGRFGRLATEGAGHEAVAVQRAADRVHSATG